MEELQAAFCYIQVTEQVEKSFLRERHLLIHNYISKAQAGFESSSTLYWTTSSPSILAKSVAESKEKSEEKKLRGALRCHQCTMGAP